MRISDWSSDVCSSDLDGQIRPSTIPSSVRWRATLRSGLGGQGSAGGTGGVARPSVTREPSMRATIELSCALVALPWGLKVSASTPFTQPAAARSEEHTSELQSLMRISYAVFCLKQKTTTHRIL